MEARKNPSSIRLRRSAIATFFDLTWCRSEIKSAVMLCHNRYVENVSDLQFHKGCAPPSVQSCSVTVSWGRDCSPRMARSSSLCQFDKGSLHLDTGFARSIMHRGVCSLQLGAPYALRLCKIDDQSGAHVGEQR